jgi:hypothetical protein
MNFIVTEIRLRHMPGLRVFWALLVVVLAGCSSSSFYQVNLMPAPAVFEEGVIDPLADLENTVSPYNGVLYVTDRMPAGKNDFEPFYRNARGPAIRAGLGQVIYDGEPLTPDEMRQISLSKTRTEKIRLRVTDAKEYGVLSTILPFGFLTDPSDLGGAPSADAEFADLINDKLEVSTQKDIFIYVHGYKVVFENPLLISTELWHFMGYDGVFLAYAWPSTPKRLAYFKDLETAQLSGHNLRLLLEYLSRRTNAERIHIIGYSAGSRVVITALHQIALAGEGCSQRSQPDLRIGQVALVGSDYDSNQFSAAVVSGLLDVPDVLTIYMSEQDDALGLSKFLFGEKRLGQMIDNERITPVARNYIEQSEDIYFVDVTDAEASGAGNGHAYFRNSPWASSDLLMTLKYGLTPAQRGLVRKEGELSWGFPSDYITRLRSAVLEEDSRIASQPVRIPPN